MVRRNIMVTIIGMQEKCVCDSTYLIVKIVQVAGYKHMDVSHDLQYIQTLQCYQNNVITVQYHAQSTYHNTYCTNN